MPPLVLIPVAYAGLRIMTSAAVDYKVKEGIDETALSALRQITRILFVSLTEISVNILVFMIILHYSGSIFDYRTSVMMICSVYAGSLIHSFYKVLRNAKLILMITRKYRLNLKRCLFDQIYQKARSEAQLKLEGMGFMKRIAYTISSGPGADTIAMRVARGALPQLWRRLLTRLLAVFITVGLYILIFRILVSPHLIQKSTEFNLLQAFLWPFAFSIDFFFNTTISKWVLALT